MNLIGRISKIRLNAPTKKLKKGIITFLCVALFISSIPCVNVFAGEVEGKANDIYTQHYTEDVNIDGVTYTYGYFYDADGNRSISISNNKSKSNPEIVTYNEKNSTIYLDGKKIGKMKTVDSNGEVLNTDKTRATWKLIGTYSKKITFAKGIAVATLAAIIATAIGGLTTAHVIASCGTAALGTIVGCSIGGTLYWTSWYYISKSLYHYRYDWAFKAPTGTRYGTYHAYRDVAK